MAGDECESQMFANVPEGFVKLLSFIVQVAVGPSVRPVFTLYPHKINDSLTMHQAAVLRYAASDSWGEPCLLRGMLCRWLPARR